MNRRDFLQGTLCWTAAAAAAEQLDAAGSAKSARKGAARRPAPGPLRPHPKNPRYFSDPAGHVVYLTGSHTWPNLVDIGPGKTPAKFDFAAYLDFLERYGHNFIRLWTWESSTWNTPRLRPDAKYTVAPQPYARTGPGKARDGKPKFDLTKFDPAYFKRLRTRVAAAGKRGIYVSAMLFEGWAIQFAPGAWESHPFHPDNNVNGIGKSLGAAPGGAKGRGRRKRPPTAAGLGVHELVDKAVTARQEAYVRKVIETVNDLDNVLYEISNENHPASTKWQYHMIDFIHKAERGKANQHPVGMTFQYRGGKNSVLFDSPAEWVSPNPQGGWRDNPPDARGKKVVLNDTDHLWGIGGNAAWVWKSFCRGLNPLFMDPYDGVVLGKRFDRRWEPIRSALGHTLRYARRMDLAAATPRGKLASTGYCLAAPGKEYLVYLPSGGKATVDLSAAKGELAAEWFNPKTAHARKPARVRGGAKREFAAPFQGHAVLYLAAV